MKSIRERQQGQQGEQRPQRPQAAQKGRQGQQRGAQGDGFSFEEPATPEEQQAYEQVVVAGMDVLYDEKTNPKIMKLMGDMADQPAQALGTVARHIMVTLDQKSGGQIPPEVFLKPIQEIIPAAAELANKAGLFQADEAVQNEGAQFALNLLAEDGYFDAEDLEALMAMASEEDLQKARQQFGQAEQPQGGANA